MATNVRKIDNLDVPFKEFMPGQIIQSGQFNDDMKDIEDKVNEIIGEQNTLVDEVNAHIDNFENPHQVTAHQTGTYTSQEIDEFVEDIKSGNLHDNAIGNRVLDDDCVSTRNILDGSITSSKLDGSVGSQIDISTNVSIKDRYTKEETDLLIQEKVGDGTYDKATIDEKLEQIQAGQILDKSINIHQLKDDVGRKLDISNNPDILNKYTRDEVDLLIQNNALPRDWGSILEEDNDTPVVIPTKEITLPVANHMKVNTCTVSESSILDVDIQENVDARGEFNTVGERLDSINSQIKEITKNELNACVFGAVGDNSTDDYVYLNNLFKASSTDIIYDNSISSNSFFTKSINIPQGIYRVKQANLFADCFSARTHNLVINGNGATIVFEEFEGYLFENNDKILNVDIYNLNFISKNDNKSSVRSLIKSTSDGGAQSIRFHQCSFGGVMKYGVELLGTNCNSEWVFNQCGFSGIWNSFLYIGETNTSDQFLNYWFNNCRYWCSSNWITAYKGGHFKLNHCDVSGFNPKVDTYLFKLLGGSHSHGVTTFIDDGTRYEIRSSHAKVIHCEWDNARISFENSDFSSNASNLVERNDVFSFKNVTQGIGSCYIFTNCNLLGKFKLKSGNVAFACELTLNNCTILNSLGITTIHDIFNIDYSNNSGAVFRVYLNHVKHDSNIYNMLLNNTIGEYNLLNNNVVLKQSPYGNLIPSWEYPIIQPTIIDEVIFFTKGYQSDGNTYEFSIKSDSGCVVTQTKFDNNPKYVTCTNISNIYVGNKITFGNSNTVYTVVEVYTMLNRITLDKDIEDSVVVNDVISFDILDITIRPNRHSIINTSDKYIVRNKLYLKTTGDTEIKATGINSAIIVKSLE